jgi:hypothetical protein
VYAQPVGGILEFFKVCGTGIQLLCFAHLCFQKPFGNRLRHVAKSDKTNLLSVVHFRSSLVDYIPTFSFIIPSFVKPARKFHCA